LARGQGLNVNEYKVVSPGEVFFVFDSASFSGAESSELELGLSVVASLLAELTCRGVSCGLATPRSKHFPQACVTPGAGEEKLFSMLELLAGAEACSPPFDGRLPVNHAMIGQTYCVARSAPTATALTQLADFPAHKVKLVTVGPENGLQDADNSGSDFAALPIERFRSAP
jgi:uncharacterized protein (DUF58 family)